MKFDTGTGFIVAMTSRKGRYMKFTFGNRGHVQIKILHSSYMTTLNKWSNNNMIIKWTNAERKGFKTYIPAMATLGVRL